MTQMFQSFIGGGFECSSHVNWQGERLALLHATGHARHATSDYRAMAAAGLHWARDGLCWRTIEARAGTFDWSSWTPMLEAAAAAGLEVAWDIVHFGYPDWLDPWGPGFPAATRRFAVAAARHHRAVTGRPGLFCPINEISFWAFAGGEAAWMNPGAEGRGPQWKEQLIRAAIGMARAIRDRDPEARLIWAEPLIGVLGITPDECAQAEREAAAQYETYDWLLGRARPELGGSPVLADALGFNFYPHNQKHVSGSLIGFGMPGFVGLADLLDQCRSRYPGHRFLLAETGAEGPGRAGWMHFIADEIAEAHARGIPLDGACLYPITDYPGWDDARICPTGLFGMADGLGRRAVHAQLAAALQAAEARLGGQRDGREAAVPEPLQLRMRRRS